MQRFTFDKHGLLGIKFFFFFFFAYLSFGGIYGASVESLLCCMRFPVRCPLYGSPTILSISLLPFAWVRGGNFDTAASECSDVGHLLQVCRQLQNRIRQICNLLTSFFPMGSNKVAMPQRPRSPYSLPDEPTG